ncbi:hypothetical protein GWQ29_12485 [Aeromonas sp. 2HA2]|uniref:hypothetical protein n=1 Tax=Aeromonas sp. 2HA2 TaxID=2699194 RepID=UPI0023DDAB9A|nr:hypothetical protein [Aeromonas sp. 2HA2]MDF2410232.1 hypothetical protein [Aeromonas sp. 2HA2]
MSEQYISSDFLEGLVVWQKSPDDEPIIVDGEEGIPYFSPNGRPRLAITKDGQLIDSVSIDITAKKVTSDDEVERQNGQFHVGSWGNNTPRLMIEREVLKEAISYSAKLRKIGWTDERMDFELNSHALCWADSHITVPSVATIRARNRLSPHRYKIPRLALAAYVEYHKIGFQKGFMAHLKGKSEEEISCALMRIALDIALLNPCLGEVWGRVYTRQGMRKKAPPPSTLEITLESLLDRLVYLEAQAVNHDNSEEWFGDEIASLERSINLIQQDIEFEKQMKLRQVDAVQAAKALLTAAGIPCKTNIEDEPWALFVAKAWSVIPSYIVSAAKILKKSRTEVR